MSVRVDVLRGQDSGESDVILSANADNSAPLEHEVDLGAGVRLTVDPARPTNWRRLAIRDWSDTALPLLHALVGRQATKLLSATVGPSPFRSVDVTDQPLDVDTTNSGPWLRVAVIQALDRWLHLPLDQALLHAELGVAMMRAALDLPRDAELHDTTIDEALGWVRRASRGVVRFLHELAGQQRLVPAALHRSLRSIVDGYAGLRAMVSEPDADLSAVVEAWKDVSGRPTSDNHHDQPIQLHSDHTQKVSSDRTSRVTSLIDPRHVRARVFWLGDEPRSPEIVLSRTRTDGQDAIRIQVPAFRPQVDPEVAQRLMARLVNTKSGDTQGFAPLVIREATSTKSKQPVFECTMPLHASRLVDFRADVFDALFRSRLGVDDDEEALMRVRQAVLSLREGRILLAQAAPAIPGPGQPLAAELAAVYSTQAA